MHLVLIAPSLPFLFLPFPPFSPSLPSLYSSPSFPLSLLPSLPPSLSLSSFASISPFSLPPFVQEVKHLPDDQLDRVLFLVYDMDNIMLQMRTEKEDQDLRKTYGFLFQFLKKNMLQPKLPSLAKEKLGVPPFERPSIAKVCLLLTCTCTCTCYCIYSMYIYMFMRGEIFNPPSHFQGSMGIQVSYSFTWLYCSGVVYLGVLSSLPLRLTSC